MLAVFAIAAPGEVEAAHVIAGPGPGAVAAREAAGEPWRILAEGDVVSPQTLMRSAGMGPRRIDLPEAVLFVDAGTDLTLDAERRRIQLRRGRIGLECDQAGWRVQVGPCRVQLSGDSAVELAVGLDRTAAVRMARGTAVVEDEKKRVEVKAGHVAPWSLDERLEVEPQRLDEGEAEGLLRWTRRCRRGQGVGQLVIRDAQSGSAVRLDVARYHVHVVLAPPVALVQIDQSFYNPYSAQEEGTFVFNLPRGASVSRFAMYVTPDQLIEGELVDRSRARTIYESIVRRRRDPAILEQIGDNLFPVSHAGLSHSAEEHEADLVGLHDSDTQS